MATERIRHLDVGGLQYGNVIGASFLGLARWNPAEDFYIADITAGEVTSHNIPSNLHISSPTRGGVFFPFLSTYKLPYANGFFTDARMDMVLDLVLPDVALKMFGEVKRCLKPGGTFNVVDEIGNKSIATTAARLMGLAQTGIMGTDELFRSHYPISETTSVFYSGGHDLFLLELAKKGK